MAETNAEKLVAELGDKLFEDGPLALIKLLQDEDSRLRAENEHLRHRAEAIAEQYDDCCRHAARLEAQVSEFQSRSFWRRLRYLVTGR